jgi:hypothetical protein
MEVSEWIYTEVQMELMWHPIYIRIINTVNRKSQFVSSISSFRKLFIVVLQIIYYRTSVFHLENMNFIAFFPGTTSMKRFWSQ